MRFTGSPLALTFQILGISASIVSRAQLNFVDELFFTSLFQIVK